ncbi:hypothetical protein BDA96_07G227100 [Sorghum bicolor]|uniref:Uncharacterized protein n=1 Tax=Sorghum bicolor TaxID=4558 RepID=A0A921UBG8_SORBI|nr:hypothetical protein BDA96_07G227100 [Sorghum bicolor]
MIAVTSERCLPVLFHNETNSSESVLTAICSLVPSGINRMPSMRMRDSSSASRPTQADAAWKLPSLPVCHAPQPRSLPCMSHARRPCLYPSRSLLNSTLNATEAGGIES